MYPKDTILELCTSHPLILIFSVHLNPLIKFIMHVLFYHDLSPEDAPFLCPSLSFIFLAELILLMNPTFCPLCTCTYMAEFC